MSTTDGRESGRLAAAWTGTGDNGHDGRERLFVVRVSDSCCEQLAGRAGGSYESPPQPLADAQALVAVLLERNHHEQIREGEVTVAIAGGSRTITLEAAP